MARRTVCTKEKGGAEWWHAEQCAKQEIGGAEWWHAEQCTLKRQEVQNGGKHEHCTLKRQEVQKGGTPISVQCTLFKSYSKQVGNVSNSFKKMNYVYCSHQRFLKTKKLNILNKRLI